MAAGDQRNEARDPLPRRCTRPPAAALLLSQSISRCHEIAGALPQILLGASRASASWTWRLESGHPMPPAQNAQYGSNTPVSYVERGGEESNLRQIKFSLRIALPTELPPLGGGIDSLWNCLPPHGSPVPSMRASLRGAPLAARPEKSEHHEAPAKSMADPAVDIRTCICDRVSAQSPDDHAAPRVLLDFGREPNFQGSLG